MKVKNRVLTAALALAFAAALIVAPHAAKAFISSLTLSSYEHSFTLDSAGANTGSDLVLTATALVGSSEDASVTWSVLSGTSVTITPIYVGTQTTQVTVTPNALPGISYVRATSKTPTTDGGSTYLTQDCKIIVRQNVDVNIVQSGLSFNAGEPSYQVTATVTPGAIDPSKYYLQWTSSNTQIATVSPAAQPSLTAWVTPGTKGGTATITAKVVSLDGAYIGGAQDTLGVAVTNNSPYLDLTCPQTSFPDYGLVQAVSLTLFNGGGSTPYGTNAAITWTLSNNDVIQLTSSSAALSSSAGTATFTTKKNGTVTLTAAIKDTTGTQTLSDSVTITVAKPLPTLSLDGDTTMNASNRNGNLTATLTQNPGNAIASNAALRWSIDKSKLATVSGAANMTNYSAAATVHSLYNGTIRVTVALRNDSSVSTYHTMYITGLSYLPQTGQDSTVLYIIGGACLVLFATAGILYARRKKNAPRA